MADHRMGGAARRTLPLWFTFLLGGVLVGATLYGLLVPDAYRVSEGVRETLPETLRGQDIVTLLAAVALVFSGLRARAGSFLGHVIWLAICLYSVYTYLMYVSMPFNDAFLLYVAAIGLSGFGLFNGLTRIRADAVADAFGGAPRRALAVFFLAVGGLFVALWLAQIVPAIPGGVPAGLFVYDIPSAVHVLDLAFILPLVIGTGVLLLRAHPMAPVLAALALVKMLTLGLALVSMNAFVAASGGGMNPGETGIWGGIVLAAAFWLIVGVRRMRPVDGEWLRPAVWSTW